MAKIMVIDDNEVILETLSEILSLEGHVIASFDSSVMGIKKMKEFGPQVIISDIFMPDKDGYEIIDDVKNIDKTCKIIIISGYGSESDAGTFLNMAKKLGADEIVSKPIDSKLLLEKIDALLSDSN